MSVLILDDENYRHDMLARQYASHAPNIWHARNLKQFRAALKKFGKFDVITFDHDIGLRETGEEAAHHLVSLGHHYAPSLCVVHSWNPIGANRIFMALRDHGYAVEVVRFMPSRSEAL